MARKKISFKVWWKQFFCTHRNWYMDNQIRTIECVKCKKRATVKEYKNLY